MLHRLHRKIHRQLSENVPVGDSLSLKVTKAADVEEMKNNPRLCSSCQKETEIVFRKDNIRLCKKCLDSFREKYD
jgi:ribosomal protein L37AE/L43A